MIILHLLLHLVSKSRHRCPSLFHTRFSAILVRDGGNVVVLEESRRRTMKRSLPLPIQASSRLGLGSVTMSNISIYGFVTSHSSLTTSAICIDMFYSVTFRALVMISMSACLDSSFTPNLFWRPVAFISFSSFLHPQLNGELACSFRRRVVSWGHCFAIHWWLTPWKAVYFFIAD